MGNVNIKKRGSVYQYEFEVPKITSKRRRITKSGFKTKREARKTIMFQVQKKIKDELQNFLKKV